MKYSIYDNGGKTIDRYTLIMFDKKQRRPSGENPRKYLYHCVSFSICPYHPAFGFCQHGEALPGKHLGKKIQISDLDVDCRQIARDELAEYGIKL